jgi:hypothetical protein
MIIYTYDGSVEQGLTFSNMVASARIRKLGPQPISSEPANFYVGEGTGAAVPYGEPIKRFVALPLISCAAVIFATAESLTAYIYHASRGIVPVEAFNSAMAALGRVSLQSVFVIYTFPAPSDANYMAAANQLAVYGIPPNNIIYAPELSLNSFGINSATVIG